MIKQTSTQRLRYHFNPVLQLNGGTKKVLTVIHQQVFSDFLFPDVHLWVWIHVSMCSLTAATTAKIILVSERVLFLLCSIHLSTLLEFMRWALYEILLCMGLCRGPIAFMWTEHRRPMRSFASACLYSLNVKKLTNNNLKVSNSE